MVILLAFLKSVSFWLSILSFSVCLSDYLGSELSNAWIRITPPINALGDIESIRNMIFNYDNNKWKASSSFLLQLTFLSYCVYMLFYFLLGFLIDVCILRLKRKKLPV
jgi:hypothetical protein